MPDLRLLIGTRKGLWTISTTDRRTWDVGEPAFFGHIVQHAVAHEGTTLVATSTGHLGPTVCRSTDGGSTWTEAARPPAFPEGDRLGRAQSTVFWR